jgi:hypothetical protein
MQFLCLIGQLLGVFFEGGSRGRRDKVRSNFIAFR